MPALPGEAGPALVGRTREREVLDVLLDRAATGVPQTLLVSGPAGVGKTALVTSATADRAGVVAVGACLPLISLRVPFVALRSAVASVSGQAVAAELTAGHESAVPERFAAWLERLCATGPLVLVVDDLHWADQATLDALMFVTAWPVARPLGVLITIRNDELGDGHPLQRWLPTVRRMPSVSELTLQPLDRIATGEQLAALLGELPHQSLVEDVYRRSGGNPYLTRLIAAGVRPDARHAPATTPTDLRSAVLQSWFRLSAQEREVATVLAVGGQRLGARELAAVLGTGEAEVFRHLVSAVEAGALEEMPDSTFWFPHPLNAEVLQDSVPEDRRRRWHAAFADLLEERSTGSPADQAVAIADHRYQAGDGEAAYRWAVRAAGSLEDTGAHAHAARMWQRALEVHPSLGSAPDSVDALQSSLRRAAAKAGSHHLELAAVEAALARIRPEQAPLAVAELLVRRMHLRFSTGRAFIRPADVQEAVRLSAVDPTSPVHALALAELAHAWYWQGHPDTPALARRALAAARAAHDDRALAFALTANAIVAIDADDRGVAAGYAREAVEAAVRAGEWWGSVHAVLWECNSLVDTWACRDYAEALSTERRKLVSAGAPHAYLAWISAVEAGSWMPIGEVAECAARLRDTLAADPGELADVMARLVAARLAVWQGRQGQAEQHLARADELFVDRSEFLAFEFDQVRAEVRLGAGDTDGAYQAALAGLGMSGVAPTACEWLVPLAARALVDRAQADHDAGLIAPVSLRLLDDLVERFPEVVAEAGEPGPRYRVQLAGLSAWYGAEQARAHRGDDEADRWAAAADLLDAAELRWEQGYCLWRAADAVLGSRGDRTRGAALLRAGLELAGKLGAEPLAGELRRLAVRARVPTGAPVATSDGTAHRHHLTAREREILGLLVAGRTYAEIAAVLVISEKTVSSHVSNLLAKTGTRNRVELAGYAVRAGLAAAP